MNTQTEIWNGRTRRWNMKWKRKEKKTENPHHNKHTVSRFKFFFYLADDFGERKSINTVE